MVIDRIISILSDYLEEESSVLDENTMLFLEYDLEDEDVMNLINLFNNEFDIEINFDDFCELSTIEEIAEYIENLM